MMFLSFKSQWEKLQSRLVKVDELLKEMDSCLLALETGIASKVSKLLYFSGGADFSYCVFYQLKKAERITVL